MEDAADGAVFDYERLVRLVKKLLAERKLSDGQMMPSTRVLCRQLGLSRNTVLRAYDELLSQGYLSSSKGVGTFLVDKDRGPVSLGGEIDYGRFLSGYGRELSSLPGDRGLTEGASAKLHYGASPAELLPVRQWRECSLAVWRDFDWNGLKTDFDPYRNTALPQALSQFVHRTRGITCSPEQIFVFDTALSPLYLLASLLLDEGDCVAVEDPGFPFARQVFGQSGCRIEPVPVDSSGMRVDHLRKLDGLKLVYVTPSHDPTGVTLSTVRREELVKLAEERDFMIIEDDYDNEFDIQQGRTTSLFGMDNRRVIHLANFWKTLYPLVNVSFLVFPAGLASTAACAVTTHSHFAAKLPCVEEEVLVRFLRQGILERHVRKLQATYSSRRRALVQSLLRHFGTAAVVASESAGMHTKVTFSLPVSDDDMQCLADAAGLPLVPLAPFYIREGCPAGTFIIPFGHFNEAVIEECVERFAASLVSNHKMK